MRVFLDANILFSAAKSRGAVRELLQHALASGHVLCVDGWVVAEARRNLEMKGSEALTSLDSLLARMEFAPFRIRKLSASSAALLPEKDQPVLAAAIGLHCDALVTGDRTHFGTLYDGIVDGVAIHSPRSLAEALDDDR